MKHTLSAHSALSLMQSFKIKYGQDINSVLREPVSSERDDHENLQVH